jgi:predicted DNA repair protein MutK
VAEAPLLNQILILSGIAILVTVGVYGLVGMIVKLDDMGYWLVKKSSALAQWSVRVAGGCAAPDEVLSIVGTLAMFLVGGGIVVHGIAPIMLLNIGHGQNSSHCLAAADRRQPGAGLYHRRGGAGWREGYYRVCATAE